MKIRICHVSVSCKKRRSFSFPQTQSKVLVFPNANCKMKRSFQLSLRRYESVFFLRAKIVKSKRLGRFSTGSGVPPSFNYSSHLCDLSVLANSRAVADRLLHIRGHLCFRWDLLFSVCRGGVGGLGSTLHVRR